MTFIASLRVWLRTDISVMAASHEVVGISVRRNQSERIGACCS